MNVDGWSVRCEYVRCGKTGCQSCPHGPYWYGYRREAGRTCKKYFGKVDPSRKAAAPKPREKEHPHDAIFSQRTASATLALEIMGIGGGGGLPALTILKVRYRILCNTHHPDRGGDTRIMARINAAFSYLKSMCK